MSGTLQADAAHGRTLCFLRSVYRGPKEAARDLDVTLITAENWWSGRPTSRAHFWRLVSRWGRQFLDFVSEPALEEADQRIDAEHAQLRAKLAVMDAMRLEHRT